MVPIEYHSACALNCPDICAYVIEVDDGRISRLRGNPNHPYTLGRCCPKGYAHVLRMYSEDRLKYPLRKQNDGRFKRISWTDALDEISDRMRIARKAKGPQSVGIYSGSGNDGMAPRFAARFANAFGCRMIPGIVEICFEGAYEGARFNVGPFPPHELNDWANSKCIVIWGTNKFESSLHSKRVIQEAVENGAKLIVIDPRKTPHAKMADIYTTIRPGTDGALALGIANEIIARGLYDRVFVEKYVHGFEEFRKRAAIYDKKKVRDITWVDVNTIEEIAFTFATHGPALIITAPAGMNHYTNGTWAARAVHSLLAICGYLGISGGGFQYLSSDNSPFNSKTVVLDHILDSSVKPIVPSGTHIPEYILSHDKSPLDVLVIQAANPMTQWPNTNKVRKAFEKIPFKVCIDLEMTDTARLCEIVLPATFIFEHDNLVHSELHRIVQFAPKIVEPEWEARDEFEIWKGLADRLGIDAHFHLTQREAMRLALDSEECRHISLEDLMEHPEGIRTEAPRIPFFNQLFKTTTGKVELYSKELELLGHDPLPFHEEPAESPMSTPEVFEEYPLIMITGRLKERLHSQYTALELGADVKSFAHCTTCQECINKCPDGAISLARPSSKQIRMNQEDKPSSKAKMRKELSSLIGGLAVHLSEEEIDIPKSITGLLIPLWDKKACIGCRECNLDICPYDVVTEPIRMPSIQAVPRQRTFLTMHPDTAATLGLMNGDRVTVESRRGSITGIRLEVTDEIDPRIVWSSDGWWERDGNINVLTEDKHTAFGHTPGFNSVLVKVYRSE